MGIVADDADDEDQLGGWTFGQVFLRAYYTVFDRFGHSWGYGFHVHKNFRDFLAVGFTRPIDNHQLNNLTNTWLKYAINWNANGIIKSGRASYRRNQVYTAKCLFKRRGICSDTLTVQRQKTFYVSRRSYSCVSNWKNLFTIENKITIHLT